MMQKKLAGIAVIAAMAMSLAACGGDSSSTADAGSSSKAETSAAETTTNKPEETDAVVKTEAAEPDDGGFNEYPIFEDIEEGFLNVSAVYFQPVPMSGGNEDISGFNIHLEADVSALENDLGFGVGDWVPYMTVDYKVTNADTDAVAAEGSFMVMSASDGPHYGANIKLDEAATYNLDFTFHSPEENGYLLHTDAATGPGGTFDKYFGNGNITVHYEGWDYIPQEW